MTIFQRIIKAVTRQWKMKLYLFSLAVILWFFVINNQTYETVIDIDLLPVKVKPNKVLVSEIPEKVEVRFTGKGKDLLILNHIQQAYLELDLHTINYFFDYPIRLTQIVIPHGLDVTAEAIVAPETVKVILEDELLKRVPVIPRADLQLQPGYMLVGSIKAEPDSVDISGPKNQMRNLRNIETEELALEKIKQDVNENIPLALPSPDQMSVNPHSVSILATVDKIAQRKLERIPVGAVRIPHGRRVSLEPPSINVTLKGSARRLAKITPDSIDAYVNLNRWNPEQKLYTPEFNLPPGLELISSNPDQVRVRVEVRN